MKNTFIKSITIVIFIFNITRRMLDTYFNEIYSFWLLLSKYFDIISKINNVKYLKSNYYLFRSLLVKFIFII